MLQNRFVPLGFLLASLFALSGGISVLAAVAIAHALNSRMPDHGLYDSYYFVHDWGFTFYVFGGFLVFALFYWLVPRVTGIRFRKVLAYLHWGTATMAALLALWSSLSVAFRDPPKRFIDYESSFEQLSMIAMLAEYVALLSLVIFAICIADAVFERIRRGKPL
ncbi:cytochrome c oxidase subunit I [Hyphomonas polymorpha PS728]|uniref:Cytochrome c oxidase subunit I n=1 Tax=Hyphomonas polymorpha PS728 TaxID=1280954 RepID=A0A062V7Y2_9PROT|nr:MULTISPECIES: hypothetical protein [Hyphomonas]AXE63480.1 hypothetical protein BBF93_04060 [Hyphomonas sp. CACIAM 19H1]KCZ98257.1 cytochrome c oxidase subunit I [Hyphomonas polymorpha PS728]